MSAGARSQIGDQSPLMTQPADEHHFELGFYVIGVFDVLGQRDRIRKPISFHPRADAEAQALDRYVMDTAGAVDLFRRLFRTHFEERRTALEQEASRAPALRPMVEASLAWNLVDWGMSDTWCVAVRAESGGAGATAAMVGIRRLIEAAAAAWFFSMAQGVPIRGGVEIEHAVAMREGDIYGLALVEAHRLESEVAEGPRIVLGEGLVDALQEARRDLDAEYQGAAGLAAGCCSLLRRDPSDWRAVVDVLGSWPQPAGPSHRDTLRTEFRRAHGFVRNELLSHEEAGRETLAARYRALLAHFEDRAPAWVWPLTI